MTGMDEIRLSGLQVYARHGVYEEEKKLGQRFLVDAVLYTDLEAAGKTDELSASTDYGAVCEKIQEILTQNVYNLLEAAAERTVEAILLSFPLIRAVRLELHKPQAPIRLPFEDVAVRICRGWHTAYVALGSNMGDREAYIRMGVEGLGEHPLCRVKRVAPFYTTTPYGGVCQEDFINTVMEVETLLSPEMLLDRMQETEQKAGRERKLHWGPRTLDLDLIFYDDQIIHTDRLTVPHPDMGNRDFVLTPLCALNPGYVHPVCRLTVAQMSERLAEKGEKYIKNNVKYSGKLLPSEEE